MAEALFLDGPLAGRTHLVPDIRPGGGPSDVFYAETHRPPVWEAGGEVTAPERVTYRLKRNRLSYGPRWVYAMGEKVGDPVVCVMPYTREAAEAMGAEVLDDMIARNAEAALQRLCKAEGLVAVEIIEAFRGTRGEAREVWMQEQAAKGAAQALAAADSLAPNGEPSAWLEGVTFVVTEAVAMPPAAAA